MTIQLAITGTAVSGSDYEPVATQVTIPAGIEYILVPVIVRPNSFLDGIKTVIATIQTNSVYGVGNASATVSIMDNDMPLVTVATMTGSINAADGQPATVVFTRAGDLNRDLTVNYLATGTATSGVDYRSLPGSVLIPAGQPFGLYSDHTQTKKRIEHDR